MRFSVGRLRMEWHQNRIGIHKFPSVCQWILKENKTRKKEREKKNKQICCGPSTHNEESSNSKGDCYQLALFYAFAAFSFGLHRHRLRSIVVIVYFSQYFFSFFLLFSCHYIWMLCCSVHYPRRITIASRHTKQSFSWNFLLRARFLCENNRQFRSFGIFL